MYIPSFNEQHQLEELRALIQNRPLGTWSTLAAGEICMNHMPFLLDASRGEHGTLVGHVARANPVWQQFSPQIESVVAFHGDQAYITPSWYPSKHKHGKAVPTWNYVVVHAHGIPRAIEDADWLLQHVTALTDTHESSQKLPWKVSDAPADFTEKLLGAIVGIEIPIKRLVGKWKLGQNRPEPDQLGVIAGLMAVDEEPASGLADELHRSREGK